MKSLIYCRNNHLPVLALRVSLFHIHPLDISVHLIKTHMQYIKVSLLLKMNIKQAVSTSQQRHQVQRSSAQRRVTSSQWNFTTNLKHLCGSLRENMPNSMWSDTLYYMLWAWCCANSIEPDTCLLKNANTLFFLRFMSPYD